MTATNVGAAALPGRDELDDWAHSPVRIRIRPVLAVDCTVCGPVGHADDRSGAKQLRDAHWHEQHRNPDAGGDVTTNDQDN